MVKSWGGNTGKDWSRLWKKIEKRIGKRLTVCPHDAEDKEEALSKDLGMHGDVS